MWSLAGLAAAALTPALALDRKSFRVRSHGAMPEQNDSKLNGEQRAQRKMRQKDEDESMKSKRKKAAANE